LKYEDKESDWQRREGFFGLGPERVTEIARPPARSNTSETISRRYREIEKPFPCCLKR